jgi:histidinol dehydrogenase
MLSTTLYPEVATWPKLLQRPVSDPTQLFDQVRKIMYEVKSDGDDAIIRLTKEFDGATLTNLKVSSEFVAAAAEEISVELLQAIRLAANNIRQFHVPQLKQEEPVETMPGITCWRRSLPIEKVGLYIPGGTAPLFSTILMLGIPAQLAGCKEVILCTPPGKNGKVHPAILVAAAEVGIQQIYTIGGVQAIAAMTYGTESVPAVYKIFGPGNQYVTAAKQLAQQEGVAIDMPAGPSEVCVWADASSDPEFVAADLLSQAEHGADSQVLLVTTDPSLTEKVSLALDRQLAVLPRADFARVALRNSKAILLRNQQEALALVNAYAPEHLIISCEDAEALAENVINAGSVFLGKYSPESVGDYASGTNHTLPTNGYARAYSGVSIDSFIKKITYQRLTRAGLLAIAPTVMEMAMAEGLQAHAQAIQLRLKK